MFAGAQAFPNQVPQAVAGLKDTIAHQLNSGLQATANNGQGRQMLLQMCMANTALVQQMILYACWRAMRQQIEQAGVNMPLVISNTLDVFTSIAYMNSPMQTSLSMEMRNTCANNQQQFNEMLGWACNYTARSQQQQQMQMQSNGFAFGAQNNGFGGGLNYGNNGFGAPAQAAFGMPQQTAFTPTNSFAPAAPQVTGFGVPCTAAPSNHLPPPMLQTIVEQQPIQQTQTSSLIPVNTTAQVIAEQSGNLPTPLTELVKPKQENTVKDPVVSTNGALVVKEGEKVHIPANGSVTKPLKSARFYKINVLSHSDDYVAIATEEVVSGLLTNVTIFPSEDLPVEYAEHSLAKFAHVKRKEGQDGLTSMIFDSAVKMIRGGVTDIEYLKELSKENHLDGEDLDDDALKGIIIEKLQVADISSPVVTAKAALDESGIDLSVDDVPVLFNEISYASFAFTDAEAKTYLALHTSASKKGFVGLVEVMNYFNGVLPAYNFNPLDDAVTKAINEVVRYHLGADMLAESFILDHADIPNLFISIVDDGAAILDKLAKDILRTLFKPHTDNLARRCLNIPDTTTTFFTLGSVTTVAVLPFYQNALPFSYCGDSAVVDSRFESLVRLLTFMIRHKHNASSCYRVVTQSGYAMRFVTDRLTDQWRLVP